MSLWMKVLLLSAAVSVLLPLATMVAVKLLRDKTGHRVCYLILMICAIRVLIPTGVGVPTLFQLDAVDDNIAIEAPKSESATEDLPDTGNDSVETTPSLEPQPGTSSSGVASADSWWSGLLTAFDATTVAIVVVTLWLGGGLVCFLVQLIPQLLDMRQERKRGEMAGDALYSVYLRVCKYYGILRPPALITLDEPVSPHLCGIWRPVVVLGNIPLDEDALEHILSHELTHYRRRDIVIKLLLLLELSLFWWNPVMWFFVRLIQDEMEYACDERVLLCASHDERCAYGSTVLHVLKSSTHKSAPLQAGFQPGRGTILIRVRSLLNGERKRGGKIFAISTVTVLLLSFFLLGSVSIYSDVTNNWEFQVYDGCTLSRRELVQMTKDLEAPAVAGQYLAAGGWFVIKI